MKTVWKFPIPRPISHNDDIVTISMPQGAEILHVAGQNDRPWMWVLVDPDALKEDRHFRFAGTGHPIDPTSKVHGYTTRMKFIGTFFMQGEALVFHIFELC